MTELLEQQGELQTKIDTCDGWEIERVLERAADALRLPPWDAEVRKIVRRRATPCSPVPAATQQARHVATR